MSPFIFCTVIGLGLATTAWADAPNDRPDSSLQPLALTPLPLGSVKPAGWLKDQLTIQANGQVGHLDEFWPDIEDAAWIGGKAEGWERVPYWLDGLVPLAYLTDDARLQAKVKKFIDYILEHQQPDGWLGPIGDTQRHKAYDVWPLFPLFKALTQYQEATGDPRVIPALLKCAKKIDEVISQEKLYSWAQVRAADFVLTLYWLYDRTKEPWLLDLARKAFDQSHDWTKTYDPAHYPYPQKITKNHTLIDHGVNTGMALKYGIVRWRLTGSERDKSAPFTMLDLLDRYHGQATGVFSCDEHLAGREPFQGTELCTVVEAMYSLEDAIAITGDHKLVDRLERLTYNALPGTFKPDMTAHQYDQQVNQVVCKVAQDRVYTSNGPDSNTYGLEPNFGCCTANQGQGWPKFVENLWMKTPRGGLAALSLAPCVVKTQVNGRDITIEVKGEYPFREKATVILTAPEKMAFDLQFFAPDWLTNGKIHLGMLTLPLMRGTSALNIDDWQPGPNVITVEAPMPVQLRIGPHDSVAVTRGPLVYSLKIGEEWKKLRDRGPFADWEVLPTTPWNYALQVDREHPEKSITFEDKPVGPMPFSPEGEPIVAHVKGRLVPEWKLEHNAAGPVPRSPVDTKEPLVDLTLVPYGCTSLRVTEFPTTK